jgi:hypothetical protein
MATVNWAGYSFTAPLNPGESRVTTFADVNNFFWFGKALSVLVQAQKTPGLDKAIEVTRVVHRADGIGPILRGLVEITYTNVGLHPIPNYFIHLGIISE